VEFDVQVRERPLSVVGDEPAEVVDLTLVEEPAVAPAAVGLTVVDGGAGAAEQPLDGAPSRPELALVDVSWGTGKHPGMTPEDPGWQELALCAQTDPEAFFPEKGGSTREAKRVCQSCEVRQECLEYALGNDERFGIWGGLSERERRRLKRRTS
jgi:WhiB family redox-sensing transcriptional regulator